MKDHTSVREILLRPNTNGGWWIEVPRGPNLPNFLIIAADQTGALRIAASIAQGMEIRVVA